jgi:hypothetical protein
LIWAGVIGPDTSEFGTFQPGQHRRRCLPVSAKATSLFSKARIAMVANLERANASREAIHGRRLSIKSLHRSSSVANLNFSGRYRFKNGVI